MPATDNDVIFVRAWIAAATALAVCACGCRQVETLQPGNVALSDQRPPRMPADGMRATGTVVEVCRIPADDAGENRSTAPDEIRDEIASIDCNLAETVGNRAPLACDAGEPLPPNFGAAAKGFAELGIDSPDPTSRQPLASGPIEDRGPGEAPSGAPSTLGLGVGTGRCREIWATTLDDALQDYSNYYTLGTLGKFIVILAPAAVFANTDWDADVGDWYQQHVRTLATNHAADVFRPLGNGFYTIPAYVSAKFLGEYFDDLPGMGLLGEFGDRTSRALLVGAPPFLALQYLTGGGRPSPYADESYWRPFHSSHGASGHAFMGAVPFLTLAGMTDDPLAKCFFYACSPWTGITRINDNVHYLSQVWLGWWMAYLACGAVDKTEKGKGPILLTPMCTPEMTGVGLIYQH